jgi:hypothetical protein
MELEKIQNLPKIVFVNDDYSFASFVKAFHEKKQFQEGPVSLRCKKSSVVRSTGNKLKSVEL